MQKNIIFGFRAFAILIVFLLCSQYTRAQGYQTFNSELEQIKEGTRYRIGPFRIFPSVMIRDIGVDNNVYRQHEISDPVKDFRFTIAVPITANLLVRNWMILSITEIPEYVFFAQEERERSFNNTFSPAFKILFFQRFVLSGRYLYRKARRRASSEFDSRPEEKLKEYSGTILYETPRRTSVGFTGIYRDIKYEDIDEPGREISYSRELNRTEGIGQIDFYYQVFSDSYFFFNGGYAEYEFEHQESSWKDSYSYYFYSGLQFPILGRIRGRLSLGWKTLEPFHSRKKGFSGPVGNTRLDYRLRRFSFRILYERDCAFSYWTNNIFFIEDAYGAGVSFYLSQFIRFDYDFRFGDAYYPEPQTFRLPDESYLEANREDKYRAHSLGFVIRVIRNTGIGISVSYWERESNFFVEDRKRIFFGGYLTYNF